MNINPSLSERHTYLDSIVNETMTNLAENQTVQQRLGELTCGQLLENAQGLFVPNLHDGVLSIPHKYRFQGTPIIALRRDETVRLGEGFGRMTPVQEDAMRNKLETWPAQHIESATLMGTRIVNALRRKEGQQMARDVRPSVIASTLALATGIGPGGRMMTHHVNARPAVVMYANAQNEFTPHISNTTNLVHELVHVGQLAERPIRDANPEKARTDKVACEGQAYLKEVAYTAGLLTSDDPKYRENPAIISPSHFELAKIYKQYRLSNDPAKFETMMAAFRQQGLLSLVLPESAMPSSTPT